MSSINLNKSNNSNNNSQIISSENDKDYQRNNSQYYLHQKPGLNTIDFKDKKVRIESPFSRQALEALGIKESELYFININEFLLQHPELRKESDEIKEKSYKCYEERRKQKLERAKQKRNELKKQSYAANNSMNLNSSRDEEKNSPLYFKPKLNSDDENEQLELVKTQNLLEIKNLIDFEIGLSNKRSNNQVKIHLQEEKEKEIYKRKKQEQQVKENNMKKLEYDRIEQEKKDKKLQDKMFKEYFKNQMIEFKKEEEKKIQLQKDSIRRQQENQKKQEEFFANLYHTFLKRQHELDLMAKELDEKNEKRRVYIEERKKLQAERLQNESKKRDEKLVNVNIKKNAIMKERLDKYNAKQEKFLIHQKEEEIKKKEELQDKMIKREEKEKKTIEVRNRNESLIENRREKILSQFKISNEKIQNQKDYNLKVQNDKIFNNKQKEIGINEVIREQQNEMVYNSLLKLKELDEKTRKVEEMKKLKNNIALKKIRLQNDMKKRKDELLEKVYTILNEGKIKDRKEVYKIIFSNEDLKLIGEKRLGYKISSGNSSCDNFNVKTPKLMMSTSVNKSNFNSKNNSKNNSMRNSKGFGAYSLRNKVPKELNTSKSSRRLARNWNGDNNFFLTRSENFSIKNSKD